MKTRYAIGIVIGSHGSIFTAIYLVVASRVNDSVAHSKLLGNKAYADEPLTPEVATSQFVHILDLL